MVNVEICIGSACYVKGARDVVIDLQQLVKDKGWEETVSIKGCFCMKSCENHLGLGVRIDGEALKNVTAQNAITVIEKEIEERL